MTMPPVLARVAVATLGSPFGPIHVAVSDAAVVGLEWLTTDEAFEAGLVRRLHAPVVDRSGCGPALRSMLDRAVDGLEAYLRGDPRGLDLPASVVGRTGWDLRVLGAVRRVGWGQVTSYGRVAREAGSPGAARAAGGAVGRNPIGLFIPCHRVIAGDGTLGGYGGSWPGDRDALLRLKRALLGHEGVSLPAPWRRS